MLFVRFNTYLQRDYAGKYIDGLRVTHIGSFCTPFTPVARTLAERLFDYSQIR